MLLVISSSLLCSKLKYKTLCPLLAKVSAICSIKVVLPILEPAPKTYSPGFSPFST